MELQKILEAIERKWKDQIEKIRIEEVNGVPLLIVEDDDEDLSCIGTVITYKTWPGMAELKGRLKAMKIAVASLDTDDEDESDDNQLADLDFTRLHIRGSLLHHRILPQRTAQISQAGRIRR